MVADGELPTVLSVQKYESGPPVATSPDGQLVSVDGDTLAATKQEEWVTKRKVELTTTKQIETRVKRQVVLEDGKIVDDSGPIVTTSTTEDTDKKESEHTEHLTQGDDPEIGEGWVAIEQLPEEAVVKETNERKVTTHDEVEEVLETEQVQNLGEVSNEAIVQAIRDGSDVRRALGNRPPSVNSRKELIPFSDAIPKRVLNQSRRHDRTTDIEDTNEISRVKENGNLVTEITRRHEHEEFHNEDIPDSDSDEFEHIENREGNQDYSHNRNEDRIEYLTYPKGPKGPGVKDFKNRHEDVMRSLNSKLGRASVSKSGNLWDGEPTPTPPPRSRRRNSPDVRFVNNPDHNTNTNQAGTMNSQHPRKYNTDFPSSLLSKDNDHGERKGYERREKSFGYTGPAGQPPFTRESLESGRYRDSGYITKHQTYYKTDETDNPAQTSLYENGDAEVTQRKTVERRHKNFTYEGPPQKQFHPKYILGTPNSTMHRLKGADVNHEDDHESLVPRSQTLPKRRFYFGDDQGSLTHRSPERRSETPEYRRGKELRFGADDINVSISNSYNQHTTDKKTSGLNRSLSFTPRSLGRERPAYPSSPSYEKDYRPVPSHYKSNPHIEDSADLLSPRLISNMSRSVRDIHNYNDSYRTNQDAYQTSRHETSYNNVSRSKKTFLDNVRKSSPDYDIFSKSSSPARSMTPTYGSPSRTFANDTRVATRPLNSPRALGGANSPLSDDYSETYRMSSSTPDNDYNQPKISTDTTSRFSRRTLRGLDGQPAGKVESTETTTRTKSRYKESEVTYPNGLRVGSPATFREDSQPKLTSGGSVIIPVKDTNNNKHSLYK